MRRDSAVTGAHSKESKGESFAACKKKKCHESAREEEGGEHHQRTTTKCRISPSIVLVGLWDTKENTFISICSGFIADATRGLIVSGANTPTSNGMIYQGDNYRLVVGCNNNSTEGFSRVYAAEQMGVEGGGLQLAQPCILRLTHVLKVSIGKNKKVDAFMNIYPDSRVWPTTLSLIEETSWTAPNPHLIPVTPEHLHSLYELGISDTLDLSKKVHIVGYDEYSHRPACIDEGYLDTSFPTMSPNSVVIKSGHQFFAADQMLGGPCISSEDGRVVGIAIRTMTSTMNTTPGHASYLMVTAPYIDVIIEEMQMLCDAMLHTAMEDFE